MPEAPAARGRLLLVANTLPPDDISGVGEQVLQLSAGLAERGYEVEILGRGPDGASGPKVLFPLTAVAAAWRRLRSFRPHLVQVHESDGGLVALLVALARPLLAPRPRLVALLQVSYVEEMRAVRPLRAGGQVLGEPGRVERSFRLLKAPFHVLLGLLTVRLADRILAPSRATARELERDYRAAEVAVVPNVTGGLERRASRGVEVLPGAVSEGGYLLFVGRLRIRKGVEVLLAAIAGLRQRRPGVRLLVVGDGEHRAALEARARQLELSEREVVFAGRREPAGVRELLQHARALVVPSLYEGMPLVILEAMEAGVPVVASRVSGIPEVVVEGETGWLVAPERPDALAAALEALYDDEEEARRRGRAGRVRVEAHFRPRNAVDAWEEAMKGERLEDSAG